MHRLLIIASLVLGTAHATPILLSNFDTLVTQNFNSLAITGTAATALPDGWAFLETGTGANSTYAATTGSTTTANTYSFGATSGADRAFGMLRSSTFSSVLGVSFVNDTGAQIDELEIGYAGEQWRLGATNRNDRLDFSYSLTATGLSAPGWTDFDALDFTAPNSTGSTGARDGNAATNRVLISYLLTDLHFAPGQTLWLRWSDFDAPGSDDGLAIDDFSIQAISPPAPIVIEPVPDSLPMAWVGATIGVMGLFAARSRRIPPSAQPA